MASEKDFGLFSANYYFDDMNYLSWKEHASPKTSRRAK